MVLSGRVSAGIVSSWLRLRLWRSCPFNLAEGKRGLNTQLQYCQKGCRFEQSLGRIDTTAPVKNSPTLGQMTTADASRVGFILVVMWQNSNSETLLPIMFVLPFRVLRLQWRTRSTGTLCNTATQHLALLSASSLTTNSQSLYPDREKLANKIAQ